MTLTRFLVLASMGVGIGLVGNALEFSLLTIFLISCVAGAVMGVLARD